MLEQIVDFLAYGSLLFAASAAYLQINKLWSRKHVEAVAESISIPGILVESIPLFFFGLYFLMKGELLGIIDSVIWLLSAVLMTMIGSGFWVKGQRRQGFWRLVRRSISREKGELTVLARELVNPSSAPQIIDVLTHVAAVDGTVDPRERELIQSFVDDWNLTIDWQETVAQSTTAGRIIDTQHAVTAYLETSPPLTQAAHLLDLLQLLIKADDQLSREEQLAIDEISGQFNQYLSEDPVAASYLVVIAPQDDKQDEAMRTILDRPLAHDYAGGRGYTVSSCFSRSYAEIICTEYRALGFFTVVMEEQARLSDGQASAGTP